MKNQIIVNNIKLQNNRIEYDYHTTGEIQKFFNKEEKFFMEYDINIENVPISIAIIPFLCNILPIAWITNSTIKVDEIDKHFFESIEEIKKGYIDMYPDLEFLGNIEVENIKNNTYNVEEKVATFFSGGVDAFSTLINHINEKPTLVTIWGADVKLNDIEGWQKVKKHIVEVSKEFSLSYAIIKSNFRNFINENELTEEIQKRNINENWWHGFQHGIGLIGQAAPYTYLKKIKTIYIASSFTKNDNVTCASDPTIDNKVKLSKCNVIHDGYEYTRQDKISNICNYRKEFNKNINLRVCWQSTGGSNCCKCEKCYRTIYGIIAEMQDPKHYGLCYRKNTIKNVKKEFKYNIMLTHIEYWKEIQRKFNSNRKVFEGQEQINWILDYNFDATNKEIIKVIKYKILCILRRIKNWIKSLGHIVRH